MGEYGRMWGLGGVGTLRRAIAASVILLLVACGGGSDDSGDMMDDGGDGDDRGDTLTLTGFLVDSGVQGVAFSSTPSGLSGLSGAGGAFTYVSGDTLGFSVGNIMVGAPVPGRYRISPKTIADSTVAAGGVPTGVSADDIATNVAVFFQTFDDDGNPDNGIVIGSDVTAAAGGKSLEFAQPTDEFVQDPVLTQLAQDTGHEVVDPAAASAHTERSTREQLAGSWTVDVSAAGGGIDSAVISFFTDGTYLFGTDHNDPDCSDGFEYGRYAIDAEAGTFQAVGAYIDTTGANGDCGLYERPEGGALLDLDFVDADTLELVVANDPDSIIELKRVPDSSDIVGSWLLDSLPGDGGPVVASFFADGGYFLVEVGESPSGDSRGIEVGTWSVDSGHNLTVSQSVDTNGDAGLSDQEGTVTLQVNGAGQLELYVSTEGSYVLDRLPLTKVIDVSGVIGAWYGSDPETPDADPEAGALTIVNFRADGRYVFGSQEGDPDCDRDYHELDTGVYDPNYDPPVDGDLDADGVGSELASWNLESGLARMFTADALVDSDGSCGLYSRTAVFPEAPDTAAYLEVVDADRLQLSVYELQDGGTGETDTGEYELGTHLLRRIPSVANSLIGSWTMFESPNRPDSISFFAGGSVFEIDTDENGGVQRETWSLNGAGDQVTIVADGSAPYCVDTIGSESDCDGSPISTTYDLAFSTDGLQATLTEPATAAVLTLVKVTSP